MASLSSAAKIRFLGGGTSSSSSRNVAFGQRSSLNSNRVSFGSLPSRSPFLTLSSSSDARTSNSINISVAAAKGSNDITSCYDALERLAIEAGKILVKEVATMFEEASKQLVADDVERLVEEVANVLAARDKTKEKTNNHAASGNDTSYDTLERSPMKAGKVLLVLDLNNTFEEEITPADEADKVMSEEEAAKKRVVDEAERVISEEATAPKIREKRFADEFERVMEGGDVTHNIKEKRVADEAEEAAKMFAEHKIKEKRVAKEFKRVIAEERKIKEKSSGDIDETEKHDHLGL